MDSVEIRNRFLNFFKNKQHAIVSSAPMVIKDDPTLMFTNAGMNQFKDIFLGNTPVKSSRVANTQKCLRVSGKHNDLEEVGYDTYHHTMFEMLGNWSFGDYFKKDAINWGWEFLVDDLRINKERLYATIFEGDQTDGTEMDKETYSYWEQFLPAERILKGNKKDNFWEMGESGPCGPCSEIHIDLRDQDEIDKIPGAELVNKDHPLVIEIWNLVFIQYNRKANGDLETLPSKHIDTGMGFERLCMVMQNKKSNYDTDIFQTIIKHIGEISGLEYGKDKKTDIAMRVIADHLRAVSFAIADGQLPSNNKAGYVIRRILRRTVRYGYTFLKQDSPFIHKLVPTLGKVLGDAFPELISQQEIVTKVIREEESSFLKTLATGIKLLDQVIEKCKTNGTKQISGKDAFTLYDTYGFPLDLTQLMVKEQALDINIEEFNAEMAAQKNRSKSDADKSTDDWQVLAEGEENVFIGYDFTSADLKITRYRKVVQKKNTCYQLVFNKTPFYGESGGQVGDTGYIEANGEKISITDTVKENNLNIHITKKLPQDPTAVFTANVNIQRRESIQRNHSATHLLHHALRKVLGAHVEQKGSLVHPDYLRFDFSHFEKVSEEDLKKIENLVNAEIRKNIGKNENRAVAIEEAKKLGAMMLFGEKYGDNVRVIQFGDSVELCGGIHAEATGNLGYFKIISESAIAAGIRRIEAITGEKSEEFINSNLETISTIKEIIKSPQDVVKSIQSIVEENQKLQKQLDELLKSKSKEVKQELIKSKEEINGMNVIAQKIESDSAGTVKDLAFQLKGEIDNLCLILGANIDGKPHLAIMFSDNLVKDKGLHAGNIVREAAKELQGGGGGQPFFASAGGKNVAGIEKAIQVAKDLALK